MPQIVSKQSLLALAALVFTRIYWEDDNGDTATDVAISNIECPHQVFIDLLCAERGYNLGNLQDNSAASAYASGVELGIAVAATIINNRLADDAIAEAVKAELSNPARWWPDAASKEAA